MGSHPLAQWIKDENATVPAVAEAADCSTAHVRNIIAGRKQASLPLAKRLSEATRFAVPMDAFLKPAKVVEAAQ